MEAGRIANACKMWWGGEGEVPVVGDGSVTEDFFFFKMFEYL